MILAIDIGNTNIVLGCMEHDRILVEARMATDLLKTSDQYCVELKNLLNLYEIDPKGVEGVIISVSYTHLCCAGSGSKRSTGRCKQRGWQALRVWL